MCNKLCSGIVLKQCKSRMKSEREGRMVMYFLVSCRVSKPIMSPVPQKRMSRECSEVTGHVSQSLRSSYPVIRLTQ